MTVVSLWPVRGVDVALLSVRNSPVPGAAKCLCLCPFGLLYQNAADWGLVNIRNVSHSSSGWKSKIKAPAHSRSGEGSLPALRLPSSLSSHGRKGVTALWCLHGRALIPFLRAPPS